MKKSLMIVTSTVLALLSSFVPNYLLRVIAVNDFGNSAASKNLKVVTLYSGRR